MSNIKIIGLITLKGISSTIFKVIEVRRDPNRTSFIALVAGWEGKRWILATENMMAGQIISTTCYIPENPQEGWEIFLRQNLDSLLNKFLSNCNFSNFIHSIFNSIILRKRR